MPDEKQIAAGQAGGNLLGRHRRERAVGRAFQQHRCNHLAADVTGAEYAERGERRRDSAEAEIGGVAAQCLAGVDEPMAATPRAPVAVMGVAMFSLTAATIG